MQEVDGRIAWAARVARAKIRRLYENDALGLTDPALIDEVGYALLERCRDILTASRAHAGIASCPGCGVDLPHDRDEGRLLVCGCGWSATWGDYLASYRRRRLHGGEALPWVREYVVRFEAARTPGARMLLIDRLIHQYHWGLGQPASGAGTRSPSRPLAVHLIEGTPSTVARFLDGLAGRLPPGAVPRAAVRAGYRRKRETSRGTRSRRAEGARGRRSRRPPARRPPAVS